MPKKRIEAELEPALPSHPSLAGVASRRSVSRWSIHLCGELRVELAGERREAQLRGRQGRLAFAYLVLHRARPVRRDELIEALWAHEGAPPSDTALAPVLSRLRRAIEPAVLEGRDTLRLVFPEPVWVDVEAIAGHLAAARAGARRRRRAGGRRRSPSPGCCPISTRRGSAARATTSRSCGSRRWRLVARAGCARRRRCRTRSAPPARRSPLAPFRESARAALIAVLIAARQHRRGDPRLRRGPGPAARGARHRCRARAGRAARAAARSRPGAGAPRSRPACSNATPSWPRSPPRCAAARRRGRRAGVRGPRRDRQDAPAGRPARARARGGRGDPRRPRRACSSASSASASCASSSRRWRPRTRRRAGARSVFGEGAAPDGLFAVLSALFHYTATLAARAPAGAVHRRPAVERHRLAALRRLPGAPHRRAAGARGDDDPHRRARRRRAAAGRARPGPGDRRRAAAAADRGRHGRDGLRRCSARPTARSPPPARRSPPATRCSCASC